MDITVCIPTIPPRAEYLARALTSVRAQMLLPVKIDLEYDNERTGAAATRNRLLDRVETEWVAFLDDDDELYPQHLRALADHVVATGADLAYPWFDVVGGTDPFPQFFRQPWDNDAPHQTTITFLAKTDVILAVGGFDCGDDDGVDALGNRAGEEYRLILKLIRAGAKISHCPERTWLWHHHGKNTSGLPDRWT